MRARVFRSVSLPSFNHATGARRALHGCALFVQGVEQRAELYAPAVDRQQWMTMRDAAKDAVSAFAKVGTLTEKSVNRMLASQDDFPA
jgi:hypothetical protein